MAIEKISVDIEFDYKKLDNELKNIDKSLDRLEKRKVQIDFDDSNLKDVQKQIEEIGEKLKALTSIKNIIEMDAQDIQESQRQIEEINNELERLNGKKNSLEIETEDLEKAKQQVTGVNEEMERLKEQKAVIEIDTSAAEEAESSLGRIQNKFNEMATSSTKMNFNDSLYQVGDTLDNIGSKLVPIDLSISGLFQKVSNFGLVAGINLANKAVNAITGSLDAAISRFDTLNNSEKVFKNMGISANIVSKEMDNLNDAITGLPTPLNEAVSSVQLLTSTNQDMGKSVKIYRALNDAVIGFGGTTQQADGIVQQFSKSMSSGVVDAQTWNSFIANGLGPTLNTLAKKMGTTTAQLKSDLSKGKISVKEFENALIDLDENGGGGMQSLQQIAKDATDGIATSWANAQTAISRGTASMIESVNDVLKGTKAGGITGLLEGFGKTVEKTFKTLGQTIQDNKVQITKFVDTISEKLSELGRTLSKLDLQKVFEGLAEGLKMSATALKPFAKLAKGALDLLKKIVTLVGGGDISKGLGKTIGLLYGASTAMKLVGKSMKGISKIPGLEKVGSIWPFGKKKKDKEDVTTSFDVGGFAKKLSNIATLTAMAGSIIVISKAVKEVDKNIPKDTLGLSLKLANLGIAISGMAAVNVIIGKLPKKAMIQGTASVVAITAELMLLAEAMKQLDSKVPSNVQGVALKMAAMGTAIGSLYAVTMVIGLITSSGIGTVAMIAGIASVTAMALEIMLLAEAMKQLDEKLPSNTNRLVKKMQGINEVLKELSKGGLLKAISRLATNAVNLVDTAVIKKLVNNLIDIAESFDELANINFNKRALKRRVEGMNEVIGLFGTESGLLGTIKDIFQKKLDRRYYENAERNIDVLIDIANKMQELESIDFKKRTVLSKVKGMNSVLLELGTESGLFGTIRDIFQMKLDEKYYKNALKTVDVINNIAIELSKLNNAYLNKEALVDNVKAINAALDEFGAGGGIIKRITSTFKKSIDEKYYKNSQKTLKVLNGIIENLSTLKSNKIDSKPIIENIKQVNAVLKELGNDKGFIGTLLDSFKKKIDETYYKNALSTLKALNKLSSELKSIDISGIDEKGLIESLEALNNVAKSIGTDGGIISTLYNSFKLTLDEDFYTNAINTLKVIKELSNELSGFEIKGLDAEALKGELANLNDIIKAIGTDDGLIKTIYNTFKMSLDESYYTNALSSLKAIIDISKLVGQLENVSVKYGDIKNSIQQLNEVIKLLGYDGGIIFTIKRTFEMSLDESYYKNALSSIKALVEISKIINELAMTEVKYGDIMNNINGLNRVISLLGTDSGLIRKIQEMFSAKLDAEIYNNALESIKSLVEISKELGKLAMTDVKYGDIQNNIKGINSCIELLGADGGIFSKLKAFFEKKIDDEYYSNALSSIRNIILISQELTKLSTVELNKDAVNTSLQSINEALNEITKDGGVTKTIASNFGEGFSEAFYKNAILAIQQLIAIGNELKSFSEVAFDKEVIIQKIKDIQEVIDSIKTLDTEIEISSIQAAIDQVKSLIVSLNGLAVEFTVTGTTYGTNLFTGFKNSNVVENIKKSIDELIKSLNDKKEQFKSIGVGYGSNLYEGFKNQINKMTSAMNSQITGLKNLSYKFSSIGTSYGSSLSNSFASAVSNLNSRIPKVNIKGSTGFSNGGEVPQYRANGGTIAFTPRGTDTVPAMLTPGEFVMTKQAHNALGTKTLDKLNNLDIQGAFFDIMNGFGTKLAYQGNTTIINNNIVNDNRRVDVRGVNNERETELKAGRFLRR